MPAVAGRSARGRRAMNEINMVPFIDVMLVLLIIFMVTAPLITAGVVDLPSVGQARQAEAQVVEVKVDIGGKLEVGMRGSKLEAITQAGLMDQVRRLQGGNETTPVVISADRNVKYDAVMQAMRVLNEGGVKRVGLSVQQGK